MFNFFKKKPEKVPEIIVRHPDLDAVWIEIVELQATQRKILQGMNKWLRSHGRATQASADAEPVRKKGVGMMFPSRKE